MAKSRPILLLLLDFARSDTIYLLKKDRIKNLKGYFIIEIAFFILSGLIMSVDTQIWLEIASASNLLPLTHGHA